MPKVNVEIEFWDALEGLSEQETRDIVTTLVADGYGHPLKDDELRDIQLSDPAVLSSVIVWLRAHGYDVEPGNR